MSTLELTKDWPLVKRVFQRAQNTGLCHNFATVNADGTPNITPIGSLVLDSDQPSGYYFDVFNRSLGENLDRNPSLAILAVDSRKLYWLASFIKRKFSTPPALRLIGSASHKQLATEEEIHRCLKEVKSIRSFGASKQLGSRLKFIRKIQFARVDVLNIGSLTNRSWN